MRLFAAAVISQRTREDAFRVLSDLARTGADYKWVERENLHVTLRFYGEREERELPALKESLARAAAGQGPFDLELFCLGAFDSLRRPKTLWLGLSKGTEELTGLAQALGEEKPKAHLTVGRQRSRENLGALVKLLSTYEFAPFGCRVDSIALVKSTLSGKGPVYEVLETVKLLNSGAKH